MTYNNQQNRGPPVPKQCFICRDNLPGSAPRMIEFRNEGYKPDGNPKAVMYEPNSNVKHIHYPKPQAQQPAAQQQQAPPVPQQPQQQQRNLPIDRIEESARMQPDAPVTKPVVQQTPIAKTYQNNPDGTPKSWTMECDVCKQKGAVGQMICGVNVGFDTTTQQYVYFITDHDPNKPNEHNIKHVHREKPVQKAPEKPASVSQDSGVKSTSLVDAKEFIASMKEGAEQRKQEAEERKVWADKMLKTTQLLLANNEMYMKAMIRLTNRKLNQLCVIEGSVFMTAHPELADTFISNIDRLHTKNREKDELEFAEDAVIFDALNIYDMREAAVPTTADTLIKPEQRNPHVIRAPSPPTFPGTCSQCGEKTVDVMTHICPANPPPPPQSFKPTQEELAQIQADEDETPDIQDDRVYRI